MEDRISDGMSNFDAKILITHGFPHEIQHA
jgi:hypothetical protein